MKNEHLRGKGREHIINIIGLLVQDGDAADVSNEERELGENVLLAVKLLNKNISPVKAQKELRELTGVTISNARNYCQLGQYVIGTMDGMDKKFLRSAMMEKYLWAMEAAKEKFERTEKEAYLGRYLQALDKLGKLFEVEKHAHDTLSKAELQKIWSLPQLVSSTDPKVLQQYKDKLRIEELTVLSETED